MNKPDVKLNPNPRMRYEITVKVDGAPGPFDRIEGSVDYKVANANCVPLTKVTGATVPPEKRVPVQLHAAGGNTYKGEIFVDLLQDEDYFGMGVCHWSIVGASADLFAHKVDFSPAIYKDDILAGKTVTRYFANGSYKDADLDRVDIGEQSPAGYKNASDVFSISLTSQEKHP
ncbi:hypothetical protein KPL74_10830 [Bacillus sp. NP157]|nr:hypothetical protein KPL74_10830 [Bacillus sp. NP157]